MKDNLWTTGTIAQRNEEYIRRYRKDSISLRLREMLIQEIVRDNIQNANKTNKGSN